MSIEQCLITPWKQHFCKKKKKILKIKREKCELNEATILYFADRNTIRAATDKEKHADQKQRNIAFCRCIFFSISERKKKHSVCTDIPFEPLDEIVFHHLQGKGIYTTTTTTKNNTENTRLFHPNGRSGRNRAEQKHLCWTVFFFLFFAHGQFWCCALTKRRTCKL